MQKLKCILENEEDMMFRNKSLSQLKLMAKILGWFLLKSKFYIFYLQTWMRAKLSQRHFKQLYFWLSAPSKDFTMHLNLSTGVAPLKSIDNWFQSDYWCIVAHMIDRQLQNSDLVPTAHFPPVQSRVYILENQILYIPLFAKYGHPSVPGISFEPKV